MADPAIIAVDPAQRGQDATADAAGEAADLPTPFDVLELSIGQPVWILAKDQRELMGTLRGIDGLFNNIVLENATVVAQSKAGKSTEEFPTMLLNRDCIAVVIPGEPTADITA